MPSACSDGDASIFEKSWELLSDLSAGIEKEYEMLKPKSIGVAISRLISRAIAVEVSRKQAGKKFIALGEIVALTVEGARVASDRPTRDHGPPAAGYTMSCVNV